MFAGVRRSFLSWRNWALSPSGARRVRRLSGLFLFEFVVVLLGVLAAQMLQEYAASSRARQDARTTLDRAEREAAGFRATAEYWLAAGPCLERQLDRLMRAAATATDDPVLGGPRPHMPFSSITPWSETTTVTVRRADGEELVTDYVGLRMSAVRMADDTRELASEWALLGLIDPAFGPVGREDRVNARLAAARMKARLTSLQVTATFAVSAADRLGIATDPARARFLALPAGCAREQA